VRAHLWFRFLPVLMFLVLAGLAATAAFAAPPTDQGSFPLSSVPDCQATAPDTGGAHICKVRAAAGGDWQAGSGEWIVIRAGFGNTQATCLAYQVSVVATITIDGKTLSVDTIPCEYIASSDFWFVDYRALSYPLPPGDHAIQASFYFTTAVDIHPAGSTLIDNATLTVAQPG
jgi:hypothetical protein